nr:MAG TPA: Minor structural protein putative tail fiber [Herelleviridae sp.]
MVQSRQYRLQASLGSSIKKVDKDYLQAKFLQLATITKVNYQYQTVELKTNRTYGGKVEGTGGEFSAPFPKAFMGKTPEGSLFGNTPLIVPGNQALVGFIDGDKGNPIILNIYGSSRENKILTTNPLESGDFSNEEIFKYGSAMQNIYPSLNYDFRDGEGSLVKTYNGKTFLSMTSNEEEKGQATDFGIGTDYQDFYTSYYNNGNEIEPRNQKAPNILFKHQGAFNEYGDADNHITSFYIDENGTIRLSILNTETQERTTQEMSSNGNYRVKYQGDDLLLDEAQVWLEYGINKEDQSFYIVNPNHKFEFKEEGIYVDGRPILDSLDNSVSEAFKTLQEVQEGLEDINYLLEGVGKDNLEELIKSTKQAIVTSDKAQNDVASLTTLYNTLKSRLEQSILKYDDFINKTYKDYTTDMDNWRLEFTEDFNRFSMTVTNIKNQYDTLLGRLKDLETEFNSQTINTWVKQNFLNNKSQIEYIQHGSFNQDSPLPTVILSTDDIKTSLGEEYLTLINKVKGELGSVESEEARKQYIDNNLKTLRQTPLKRLIGKEKELVVQYKDDDGIKTIYTTDYKLLYNDSFIPLDDTQKQVDKNGIISKFKISYKLQGEPVEEKGFTSVDW